MGLIGRPEECAALGALLDTAREGLSATVVIRGEAGVGKTALARYAVEVATDFLVITLTGVESEQEIAFGALHRLLAPFFTRLPDLPAPQRAALRTALGFEDGPPADRFLVGLATISLTTMAARTAKRLLCVVDDAQWIDRESLQALTFWARRIDSDGVAILFSERITANTSALEGFPVLEVSGLAEESARVLLATSAKHPIDAMVVDRIIADTRGNPLALTELAKDVEADVLIGAAATAQPLPLTAVLEERYARQVRSLPTDTQMLLLVAAADSSGDPTLVLRAASELGLSSQSADAAESAGVITVGSTVEFRHPLIRSAVYGTARPVDRRAAHRALAVVTETDRDADRRAWHLAAATIGHDADVAATLEQCAARAAKRGGHTAELALLTRSADLTPDQERAAERLVAAADAALKANLPRRATALIEQTTSRLRAPAAKALAQRLLGCATARTGRLDLAGPILLDAARALVETDNTLARKTLLEAIEASLLSLGDGDDTNRRVTRSAALAANEGNPGDDPMIELFLTGLATYVTSGFVDAAPQMRAALRRMVDDRSLSTEHMVRCLIPASYFSRALWDIELHDAVMTRVGRLCRERGELRPVYVTLQALTDSSIWAGRFDAAATFIDQSADIAAALGEALFAHDMIRTAVASSRGQEAEVRAATADHFVRSREFVHGVLSLRSHMSVLEIDLGLGRYSEALEHASAVYANDLLALGNLNLPNTIEAAIRSGERAQADVALERLTLRATAADTPWALGLLARSRALLADDDAAESLYREAIGIFEPTRLAVDLARSHLVFGEWLRRQNRRIDARDHLRVAHEMFATMGSEAFAGRAHAELLATGEHARKRTIETTNVLTPREAHVAQLAADGQTNAEIAAELYIGSTTVDYHLRKVFRKLAVTSRRQLRDVLARA